MFAPTSTPVSVLHLQLLLLSLSSSSIDAEELTPTLKVRRHVIVSKYREEIDWMYGEGMAEEGREGGRKKQE